MVDWQWNTVFPSFIHHIYIFGVWIMTINNQQDRIICRMLNEVNKIIGSFSKYFRLNPTIWMASRNWARRCSIYKLQFHIFLGNTINGETYVPVAFIQVTAVIRFPLSADVRETKSFNKTHKTRTLSHFPSEDEELSRFFFYIFWFNKPKTMDKFNALVKSTGTVTHILNVRTSWKHWR